MHDAAFHALANALRDRTGQHRVRADLDEHLPFGIDAVDRLREEHRLAHVTGPVARVEIAPAAGGAADRGPHRNANRRRRQAGERRFELAGKRLHLVAVEGVVHRDRPAGHLPFLERDDQRVDRRWLTGHDGRGRRVDGGDRNRAAELIGGALRFASRQVDDSHLPHTGGPLHDATAMHGDPGGLLDRQRAGRARRRELAHAVADHGCRRHPARPPQRRQRHLHRKQHRLCELRLVQTRRRFAGVQLVDDRPAGQLADVPVALGDDVAEHRLLRQELTAHSPPLRALSAEHEDDRWRAAGQLLPDRGAAQRLARHERVERAGKLVERRAEECRAMLVMRAPHRRGEAHVLERCVVPLLIRAQPIAISSGERAQRRVAACRNRQQVGARRADRRGVPARVGHRRGLLDDHVGVGADQPNELTPASRGAAVRGHGRGSVGIASARARRR